MKIKVNISAINTYQNFLYIKFNQLGEVSKPDVQDSFAGLKSEKF